jgi:hypothetical protein
MAAELNRLIAMGGTQNKSPVQRYMETRAQVGQERQNKLAMESTRQNMDIRRQQMAMQQQKFQGEQDLAYAEEAWNLFKPVDKLKSPAEKESAYKKRIPELNELRQKYGKPPDDGTTDWNQEGFNTLNAKFAPEAFETVTEGGIPIQRSTTTGKEIASPRSKKTTETFSSVLDAGGKVVAQKSDLTGRVYSDPRAPKDPDTVINNNLDNQNELSTYLSRELGKDLVTRRKEATDAKHSLISSNTAIDLLNEGIITGTGANFLVATGKALQRVGINFSEDAVENTEAFVANQAKQVAQIIKAFGAGTGLSDADREYAEKAAAGKITASEKSIRRIIDINQRASMNVIQEFNTDIGKLPKGVAPYDLTIETPELKSSLEENKVTSVLNEADAIIGR